MFPKIKSQSPKEISNLVIAKRHGAAGGKGYFMASTEQEYNKKRDQLIKQGLITGDSDFVYTRISLRSFSIPSILLFTNKK